MICIILCVHVSHKCTAIVLKRFASPSVLGQQSHLLRTEETWSMKAENHSQLKKNTARFV